MPAQPADVIHQLVVGGYAAIAVAHVAGDADRVDALARDGSVLVAWISAKTQPNRHNRKDPS
jgi:hypothetical protein